MTDLQQQQQQQQQQQPKVMTKHKQQAELEPPPLDAPLSALLAHGERDMKFRRRELMTKGIPEVESLLRQLENRSDTPTVEDDGKPRRRRRRVRRSRHALFDTVHRSKTGRGMTPEDVYQQSLQWDDKQSLHTAGPLLSGASSSAGLSFTSVDSNTDAFSDQENDEARRVECEAMRSDIAGEKPALLHTQMSQQRHWEPERSEADIGKELFADATVATQIDRGTHALAPEERAARDKAKRGVPDGVALRDPGVVAELYEADILQGAGIDMSFDAAAHVIMQAALAGMEETRSRAPAVEMDAKARARAQVRQTYVPPCSPLVTAARTRLRTGEAGKARSKAARASGVLSNMTSSLVQASNAAREKVESRDTVMREALGLTVDSKQSPEPPKPSPLTQYLSQQTRQFEDCTADDLGGSAILDGVTTHGDRSDERFEGGDSLVTAVDFDTVFSSELFEFGGGRLPVHERDAESTLPSLTPRTVDSALSRDDISSRGSARHESRSDRRGSNGPSSRDKSGSRLNRNRKAPGTRDSFYGLKARQEFFEMFHDQRARTPDAVVSRHSRARVPPVATAAGARPGSSSSSSSLQARRPSSRPDSARATYLRRCHEPLQLVQVSVRDVAEPRKSFEVAVDSDAVVDDLIELVVQHTGKKRDCLLLKLKAKDIHAVFRKFDLDSSGTVDYDEFRMGLRSLGIKLSDKDFDDMMGALDNDRDGEINYDELIEDMRDKQRHEEHVQGGFFATVEVEPSYMQHSEGQSLDTSVQGDPSTPAVKDQMRRAPVAPQSPDYDGKAVIRRVAAAIERVSGEWLDPTKTVAELEQQGGRVLLELIFKQSLPAPPRMASPTHKHVKQGNGKGKGGGKGKAKGEAKSKSKSKVKGKKTASKQATAAARRDEVIAQIEAHKQSKLHLAEDRRRKTRGAAALSRQQRSTIQIEADPHTGRFVQHQVPIKPLPLLISKGDGEREDLLKKMIDEMDETEAVGMCDQLGEELPERTLQMAQFALRMHFTENKEHGMHINTAGTVSFSNYQIGDQQLRAYADGLRQLGDQGVSIRRLELANNAITDDGLVPLARALMACSRLEYVDLSENRIRSDGCEALGRLLRVHDPPSRINTLKLAKNNLGDGAGMVLCDAIADQLTVTALDLSSNNLGGLRFGESLRCLLENNSVLQRLELGWNGITSSIARKIVPALSDTLSLQYLGLQWNALGDVGGVALGYALRHNQTLQVLDVSHCNIGERGTMVLSDMLIENRVITSLLLDDNPVGKRGGRAILRALRSIVLFKMQRSIMLRNCNFNYQSPEHLFDPSEPGGTYVCNLADPYERVVGNELVELAWREVGENWENETLDGKPFELPEPPEGVIWTREDYRLPESGVLSLKYRPTKRVPRMEQVIDEPMFEALCMMMQDKHVTDQGFGLMKLASEEWFFSSRFAGTLAGMFSDSVARVKAMAILMPRVVDLNNWGKLVMTKLTDDECKALEMKVGELFFFSPSNPTGHYKLELANPHQRIIAKKLIELSSEEKLFRREHELIDTSQKGDMDNWRNETLNGKPWDYDEDDELASKLPTFGTLEFDYVSTAVAHRMVDTFPISDEDFAALQADIKLINTMVKSTEQIEPEKQTEAKPKPRTKRRPVRRTKSVDDVNLDQLLSDFGDILGKEACKHALTAAKGVMEFAAADLQAQCDAAKKLEDIKLQMERRRSGELLHGSGSIPVDNETVLPSARAPRRRRGSVTGLDDDALMAELARDTVRREQEAVQAAKDRQKHQEDDSWQKVQNMKNDQPSGGMTAVATEAASSDSEKEEDEIPEALEIDYMAQKKKEQKEHEPDEEEQPEPEMTMIERAEKLMQSMEEQEDEKVESSEVEQSLSPSERAEGARLSMTSSRRRRGGSSKADVNIEENANKSQKTTKSTPEQPQKPRRGRRRSVTMIAFEGGESTSDSDDDNRTPAQKSSSVASKTVRASVPSSRKPWWLASQQIRIRVETLIERELVVMKRALLLLRRATAAFYFTSAQVEKLLDLIPNAARVEAMVLFFARVLDIEVHHQPSRLQNLLPGVALDQYRKRIGAANILCPIQPDGLYDLDLRVPEDRSVASMLVVLAAEPGENWLDETYNGMPFDLGKAWEKSVPTLGLVKFEFKTGKGTADLRLRCDLARRHLMPGRDRWKALDPELIAPSCKDLDPDDFDDTSDLSMHCVDADGTLKPIHAVFNDCDRDRSGFLSKTEFEAAMARLNCDASPSAISKIWRAKHSERVELARQVQLKGGPMVSGTPGSRDFSAARLSIGGSDEEADDEKVDEVEFAELYKKLVHFGRKV